MSLEQVSHELRAALVKLRVEHGRLNAQIQTLEGLLRDLGEPVKRGPGRPKGSRSVPVAAEPRPRKKPRWSAASREAARKRAQAMWAARRKKKG
ncbi:MAG: hypothetical protein IT384_07310 [Deltaproteobacteria bacterium]|nr:hypothetical protein [Deltaproteobacteria bacterium]